MPDEAWLAKSADAGRMGKAVEHLVASSCIISSHAKLNVSTALVDDEGVDLVFHRRGGSATLAVQVKARMSDAKAFAKGSFVAFVRSQTFRPRADLYMLFVAVNIDSGTYDTAWLVPSIDLAGIVKANKRDRLRFAASMKPAAKDRWRKYRLTRADLPVHILAKLKELERNR